MVAVLSRRTILYFSPSLAASELVFETGLGKHQRYGQQRHDIREGGLQVECRILRPKKTIADEWRRAARARQT